jgi:hypothetical protein
MTLGETMQQSESGSSLAEGQSAPPLGPVPPHEPTLNNVGGEQAVSAPGRSTALSWDQDSKRGGRRLSWLVWAVPVSALFAFVALGGALWMLRSRALQDSSAEAASGVVPVAASGNMAGSSEVAGAPDSVDSAEPPVAVVSASASATDTAPPPAPTPAATKTATPSATKTAAPVKTGAPAKTGTSLGDDFLPTDRK